MSFFGFDTSGHDKARPGFSQAHDPFAGLSGRDGEVDDALEFEDTYDGLGDQLDDADDAFNDDTFGGGAASQAPAGAGTGKVGKDFDFFGQTAKVSGAIEEEHMRFDRQRPAPRSMASQMHVQQQQQQQQQQAAYYPQQPVQQSYRPARTGYEKYKEAEPMPELNVDRSIWGMGPAKTTPQAATPPQPQIQQQAPPQANTGRKIMSLEEVEAAMRQQPKQPTPQQQPPPDALSYAHAPPGYDIQ